MLNGMEKNVLSCCSKVFDVQLIDFSRSKEAFLETFNLCKLSEPILFCNFQERPIS